MSLGPWIGTLLPFGGNGGVRLPASAEPAEEGKALLWDVEKLAGARCAPLGKLGNALSSCAPPGVDMQRVVSRSLDVFKGVLVVFMTYAHVDLCLLNPALTVNPDAAPHIVGNVASGLCFLGFMLAYGFGCDGAYLADWKVRPTSERLARVARSALLPVCASWICSCAWGFMCFKFPMDENTLLAILKLRIAVGNGPDFLLCFTICLLAMYPLRHLVNQELSAPSWWRRSACAAMMLLVPLGFTSFAIQDCTGNRIYLNYFLECNAREAWAPNLAALPHLFYFNLGVLLSRGVRSLHIAAKAGRLDISVGKAAGAYVVLSAALLLLSVPLMSVWNWNYGNLTVETKWGAVNRGFSNGPSTLWLVGNLFCLDVLFAACAAAHLLSKRSDHALLWPFRFLLHELEHLGANILIYLVVADICLAGLYRGLQGQFPLQMEGCGTVTLGIILVTRFIHYLGASSRPTDRG